MVREEVGNLVTGKYPVFCHQVNCKGAMGAGVADSQQLSRSVPRVQISVL